jgi:cytochrome P450
METGSIPPHVPQHLAYPFDHQLDPLFKIDPHKRISEIIEQFPEGIFYSTCRGGFWVITGYNAYCKIARNPAIFSSKSLVIPPHKSSSDSIPITIDPPQHAKYRAPLMAAFGPAKVQTMQDSIRTLINQLIDQVIDQRACNFIEAVAEPLPIIFFMQLMGLPLERKEEFRSWAVEALSCASEAERLPYLKKVDALFTQIITERQQQAENDLISQIIAMQIDARPITTDEVQGICRVLFFAGLDTVVNAIAYGIRHLAGSADLQQNIRKNPEIAPAVVDEMLRCYSFVNTGRMLTRDFEFQNLQLKKGEMVFLCNAAADRDPLAFKNPEQFDLDREGPRHVAFNTGPHQCIGSNLARMELKILYQEWCKRIENFHLDTESPPTFISGVVLGMQNLHIKW